MRVSAKKRGFKTNQIKQGWDGAEIALFDPNNATHRDASIAELQAMREQNLTYASTIGLVRICCSFVDGAAFDFVQDTFSAMPAWHQFSWLKQMQLAFPEVKSWVTEAWGSPDFVNSIAGGYHLSSFTAFKPNFLGDFLMPNTEWWLQV